MSKVDLKKELEKIPKIKDKKIIPIMLSISTIFCFIFSTKVKALMYIGSLIFVILILYISGIIDKFKKRTIEKTSQERLDELKKDKIIDDKEYKELNKKLKKSIKEREDNLYKD